MLKYTLKTERERDRIVLDAIARGESPTMADVDAVMLEREAARRTRREKAARRANVVRVDAEQLLS